jgi:SAM-dependent methyltransferase
MDKIPGHQNCPYYPVVLSILRKCSARIVLDAACGSGWLGRALKIQKSAITLDGAGLWGFPPTDGGYRNVIEHDLNKPMPGTRQYDAVVCCEVIHSLTNPGCAVASFAANLRHGGTLVITTPNIWYMRSRLQFFLRGFHSGFRSGFGKKEGQDYITYFPFTFSLLHQLLSHYGYGNITLHEVDESKPHRWVEYLLALPGQLYYRLQRRKAKTKEEALFWDQARSAQSVHGRWLVVSATHSAHLAVS